MPAAAHSKTDGANVEYFPPPKPWRLEGDRLHLVGMACAVCGTKAFPAREVCSGCGSDDVKPCELAASGNLYSFSEVHVAPKGFAVTNSRARITPKRGRISSRNLVWIW